MTQTPNHKIDWQLIVGIMSLIIAIITGVPSVYEFAEKQGLLPEINPQINQTAKKPFIF